MFDKATVNIVTIIFVISISTIVVSLVKSAWEENSRVDQISKSLDLEGKDEK